MSTNTQFIIFKSVTAYYLGFARVKVKKDVARRVHETAKSDY
jgi:predicted ATP-grasp superfamily ATP-dependent carboligase